MKPIAYRKAEKAFEKKNIEDSSVIIIEEDTPKKAKSLNLGGMWKNWDYVLRSQCIIGDNWKAGAYQTKLIIEDLSHSGYSPIDILDFAFAYCEANPDESGPVSVFFEKLEERFAPRHNQNICKLLQESKLSSQGKESTTAASLIEKSIAQMDNDRKKQKLEQQIARMMEDPDIDEIERKNQLDELIALQKETSKPQEVKQYSHTNFPVLQETNDNQKTLKFSFKFDLKVSCKPLQDNSVIKEIIRLKEYFSIAFYLNRSNPARSQMYFSYLTENERDSYTIPSLYETSKMIEASDYLKRVRNERIFRCLIHQFDENQLNEKKKVLDVGKWEFIIPSDESYLYKPLKLVTTNVAKN